VYKKAAYVEKRGQGERREGLRKTVHQRKKSNGSTACSTRDPHKRMNIRREKKESPTDI